MDEIIGVLNKKLQVIKTAYSTRNEGKLVIRIYFALKTLPWTFLTYIPQPGQILLYFGI